MAKEVKLSPPWIEYVDKLDVFFKKDDDIEIDYEDGDEEDEKKIKIFVDNQKKAEALEELLPREKFFGNVKVNIVIIPNNEDNKVSALKTLLEGNEAVSFIETITMPFAINSFTYVVFEKEVVQYWNDNLADYNGLTSTLYQDLAKEIFEDANLDGVYFCTDED